MQFERDGHVTVSQLFDANAMTSLQQAAKQIIADGELEALRHRCEALMVCQFDIREVPSSTLEPLTLASSFVISCAAALAL